MAAYSFVTDWEIDAPIDRVWDAISHPATWPRWWSFVDRVEEIAPGDSDGIGSVYRYVWKTALPFTQSTVARTSRANRPVFVEFEVQGKLKGSGRCHLAPGENSTQVHLEWDLKATRGWMNLLAPVLRPPTAWNQRLVMRAGEAGLRRYLADARDDHRSPGVTLAVPAPRLDAVLAGAIALAAMVVRSRWIARRGPE